MTSVNLAHLAIERKLTVEEVNHATKEKLEGDKDSGGYTVLWWAIVMCPSEIVKEILHKGVNIDALSGDVSIVVSTYYLVMVIIKLTLFDNKI
jgi:hypothetical protein